MSSNPTPTKALLIPPSELVQVITRLSDILEAENSLLTQSKTQEFSANLAEKSRLVAIYNQQMTLIKNDPVTYKTFPAVDIENLKDISEKFYAILDAHFRKLSTVKTVTEGLVKSVAEEVAKKKTPPSGYTASAALSSPLASKNARTINGAIAINQMV
ncbi:hypothetical protein [Sneathiella sp.]|uniref:hypothetical protein n=1 Tax=Sneathiella sp. TaxID=1964365 RepID=UPI003564D0F0